jgi:hypothetical protein
MPIDFAAIAAQFREPLTKETRPLVQVFEKLEEAVKKVVERSEAAERATRAYPILRYRDGALAVWVDPQGAQPLRTAPARGFVEGLRAGGVQFLAGIGWTRTALRQELAIPGLVAVGADALAVVLASLERFAGPTPAMFDPRARRLSDVFGLLVLAYNSLLGREARDQLVGAAQGAVDFKREVERLFPPSNEVAPAPTVGTVDRLVTTFEGAGVQLLDAVVLLPILGEALAVVVQEGALEGKRLILTELSELEAQVVGLRAAAIEGLIEGADLGGLAAQWLLATRAVVLADLDVLTKVAPSLLDTVLNGTRAFAQALDAWGQWVQGLTVVLFIIDREVLSKVDALLTLSPLPAALPPSPPPPKTPLAGFPDVYEALFGGGRAAELVATIDRFGGEAREGIQGALSGAVFLLDELGAKFGYEAQRAATMGTVTGMRELALGSAELAERVFGPEAELLQEQLAGRRPDELARTFEEALTAGGFALVGNAIPAYVGELRRFWAERRPPAERPTSPHILARHGRLGGVRVPRMTVRARGRAPDAELATLVAARFRDAVGEAYVGGRSEFERLGGPPLRRPARRPAPTRGGARRGR